MGGNCVSTSYKTKEPGPTGRPQKGQDTSIRPDDPGYPPDSPKSLKDLEWDGLQMGINEHGSYMVLDKEEPEVMPNPPRQVVVDDEHRCCGTCQTSLERSFRPCLTKHNSLSNDSSCCKRLRYAFLCPPHGVLSRWLTLGLIGILVWAVLWSITGPDALPGGNLFGLCILIMCCFLGGALVAKIHLPPLLGKFSCRYSVYVSTLYRGLSIVQE